MRIRLIEVVCGVESATEVLLSSNLTPLEINNLYKKLPYFLVVFLGAALDPVDSGLTYVAFAADIASL